MKVWAIPVGQEETPTMTVSPAAGADDAAVLESSADSAAPA